MICNPCCNGDHAACKNILPARNRMERAQLRSFCDCQHRTVVPSDQGTYTKQGLPQVPPTYGDDIDATKEDGTSSQDRASKADRSG